MATIRLNKLCREFNIGLDTLVSFLRSQGCIVPLNPNAKIDDSFYPLIKEQFEKDAKMKEISDKMPKTFDEAMASDMVFHCGPIAAAKKKAKKKKESKAKQKANEVKKPQANDSKPTTPAKKSQLKQYLDELDWDFFSGEPTKK